MTVNSFYQSALVFTSQNFGAKKLERIKKTLFICLTYVVGLGIIQSAITFFLGETLVSFYIPGNPEAIEMGVRKLNVIGYAYVLLGFMNIMSGALRGMGASFINMVASIAGVCGIRIMWVLTAFKAIGTFESLFLCYPISWFGTFVIFFIMFLIIFKKEKRSLQM